MLLHVLVCFHACPVSDSARYESPVINIAPDDPPPPVSVPAVKPQRNAASVADDSGLVAWHLYGSSVKHDNAQARSIVCSSADRSHTATGRSTSDVWCVCV